MEGLAGRRFGEWHFRQQNGFYQSQPSALLHHPPPALKSSIHRAFKLAARVFEFPQPKRQTIDEHDYIGPPIMQLRVQKVRSKTRLALLALSLILGNESS